MRVLLACLLLPLVASGCILSRNSLNQPLTTAEMGSLVPGESTAADVVAKLGAPNEVVQLARRSAYRYDFTRSKNAGLFLFIVNFRNTDTRQDRVWVFFDEENVLTHLSSTFQADGVEWAFPWEDVYD